MSASGLNRLCLVCLTVSDVDRSIEFYVEKLGFEKRTDEPFGNGYRWVEVYMPGDTTGIALAPPPDSQGTAGGANTGITIATADVDATHGALRDAGVDVDEQVARMGGPVPPMFWLRDPDANVLMVVEQPMD